MSRMWAKAPVELEKAKPNPAQITPAIDEAHRRVTEAHRKFTSEQDEIKRREEATKAANAERKREEKDLVKVRMPKGGPRVFDNSARTSAASQQAATQRQDTRSWLNPTRLLW